MAINIRPGELRDIVKFQQRADDDSDESGQPRERWISWPTGSDGRRHCSVSPTGGGEGDIGGSIEHFAAFEIKTHYRKGFNAGLRFLWRGRTFNITSVEVEDERQNVVIMNAREVAA